MPSTRIDTGEWVVGRERELIEAVQEALASALKLPDWDRDIVLTAHAPATRIVPTGRSERFVRIEVLLFAGRSMEAKRRLYRTLVDNLEKLGVRGADVKVALVEVPAENWGIRGGQPASEVDLGFEIKV
jgi:phenylpyruvate tautomerase PptA (4-oxalocrotonate tautomerase family)